MRLVVVGGIMVCEVAEVLVKRILQVVEGAS